MKTDSPKTIYLKDYSPYPYSVKTLDLNFDIREGYTLVTARSTFQSKDGHIHRVILNGEDLELLSITLSGEALKNYERTETLLCFTPSQAEFSIEIITKIYPEKNTRLEGLYMSGGNYCTQCEAEGFRRITYWPDRPDVLSIYTVRVEAERKFPILLSNGNKVSSQDCARDRHAVLWHDPFPKPCYLFALVAGDLACVSDTYTTLSGRTVALNIYVRPGDEPQCDHAMQSLKKSMRWDEDTYGLEYDLDLFNIVAVSDFNMGAMENKSLNIFNTALVLAHTDTATDTDFARVESVIAHEYFHNWSGNRVTCRDWFQLSLKEGLTVFRDQEFSSDMHSKTVQRIEDVIHLRRLQFAEDSSPLAHPVRPDQYIEINNFYTMTIYEKGAELIRMMRTILGEVAYRRGTDLYFSRHDAQAVTCDDFIACMAEAGGVDFSQFKLWYTQAGTPEVFFKGIYDEKSKTYTIELKQKLPEKTGQSQKHPMHIPVALGLLSPEGDSIDLGSGTTTLLHLTQDEQNFKFENIPAKPIASVLRHFSAPVKLHIDQTENELAFLIAHDTDGFNRWEAAQKLYARVIHAATDALAAGQNPIILESILAAAGQILKQAGHQDADKAFLAQMLTLPDVGVLEQARTHADPPLIYKARQILMKALATAHRDELTHLYSGLSTLDLASVTSTAAGNRALRNAVLAYLTAEQNELCAPILKQHYEGAGTMTDRIAALAGLTHIQSDMRSTVFDDFYNKFKAFPLVIDKWVSLQAISSRPDIINDLKKVIQSSDFNIKNPNRVRALYASFAMNNPVCFHAADGSGYAFLADAVIKLNSINPQIAARLLTPFRSWKNYDPERKLLIRHQLQRIVQIPNISPDVYEIASKNLAA